MEGGAISAKAVGIGSLAIVVLGMIALYIYSAVIGTKNLSWQTVFFIIGSVLIAVVGVSWISFKAGRGFASKL